MAAMLLFAASVALMRRYTLAAARCSVSASPADSSHSIHSDLAEVDLPSPAEEAVLASVAQPSSVATPSTNTIQAVSTAAAERDACADCVETSIANTVKPYDRHAVVCGVETMEPGRIEKGYPFIRALQELLEENLLNVSVKLTACDHVNSSDDHTDVIVYPEQVVVSVPRDDTEKLAEFSRWLVDPSQPLSLPLAPTPWKRMILVCRHKARDARCGAAGPLVIEELRAALRERGLDERDVCVRGSTHLGGHEWAGVVVVYPQCDWYGYISVSRARDLLDCVLSGTRLEKCWRGTGAKYDW